MYQEITKSNVSLTSDEVSTPACRRRRLRGEGIAVVDPPSSPVSSDEVSSSLDCSRMKNTLITATWGRGLLVVSCRLHLIHILKYRATRRM